MKPPSRQRHLPSRLLALNKAESRRSLVTSWHHQDMNKLLLALKHHHKFKKLDVFELRKKVPKFSVPEIHNMIKTLKKQVVRQVYQQIQKQRQEELKIKVPIEIWAEFAQRMAGAHEETISSAFSQMLVIAATEPCSLLNSNPPHSINTPDLVASNLQTIPMRPHYMSPSVSTMSSTSSPVIILPVQTPSAQATGMRTLQPKPLKSHPEKKSNESNCVPDSDPIKPSTSRTSKAPSNSKNPPVLKSAPSVSTLESVSTTPALLPSLSDQPVKPPENGQSNQGYLFKSMSMQYVVNFEKIYQFLGNINKNNNQPLTAMESAVLLDLLMSLPEELPLLDCKELQHHLLLEYTRMESSTVQPSNDQIPATERTEQTSQAKSGQIVAEKINPNEEVTEQTNNAEFQSANVNDSSQLSTQLPKHKGKKEEADWAAVGLCPLNPFMVPVALLKRQ